MHVLEGGILCPLGQIPRICAGLEKLQRSVLDNLFQTFFKIFFTKYFVRIIGNDDNSKTICPFELNSFSLFKSASVFKSLLLVPNKPITNLRIRFFLSILGKGVARTA